MKHEIETNRLLIRRFKESDAADLFAYASCPLVGPEAGWMPHQKIEDSKDLIAQWHKNLEVFAIEEKASHQVIGSIGLHQTFERAVPCRELGYALKYECWGKGYMSEACAVMIDYAFEQYGVEMIIVKHHHLNLRSRKVIEKAGFHLEGILRQARVHALTKELLDTYVYSMTKEEWRKLRCIK